MRNKVIILVGKSASGKSTIEKRLRPYIKQKNVKLVVHTERPFVSNRGFSLKQTIKNILFKIIILSIKE